MGDLRQQCVLAVLLVNANWVISVDELIDSVWAGRPPQRVRRTLHSYRSRVRRMLEVAADEVRIARRPAAPVGAVRHRGHLVVLRSAPAWERERLGAELELNQQILVADPVQRHAA